MQFGEKLQLLRKARGWSQEELAQQINVSRQALSKWESGAAVADTENVIALSRLFGVSTDYLLLSESETAGAAVNPVSAPAKESKWPVPRIVLYAVFLMVVCICGTILLVCNLYNGEVFEPTMHRLALQMIKGSILAFVVSVIIGSVVFTGFKKKRMKAIHGKKN